MNGFTALGSGLAPPTRRSAARRAVRPLRLERNLAFVVALTPPWPAPARAADGVEVGELVVAASAPEA